MRLLSGKINNKDVKELIEKELSIDNIKNLFRNLLIKHEIKLLRYNKLNKDFVSSGERKQIKKIINICYYFKK